MAATAMQPPARPATQGPTQRPASAESWKEYNFEWLFDPDNFDHLPIEEQLKLYKHRDLKKTKAYKFATQIWGAPLSRKRKIIAKPMERVYRAEPQTTSIKVAATPSTSPLKLQLPPPKLPSSAEIRARQEREKIEAYEKWVKERKDFRKNLESMGLQEEWLARKPDRTPLEQRVLNRLIAERNPEIPPPTPKEEPDLEPMLPEESPVVKRPSPLAIRIIEKFLRQKKIRLIDLFQSVDKDKDWKVSRNEFRNAMKAANIPISEVLLEDLILALDTDLNNELDYRELAKGMGLWRIEKRESKRKMLSRGTAISSPAKYSQVSGFNPPDRDEELEMFESEVLSSKMTTSSPTRDGPQQQDSRGVTPDGAGTVAHTSPSRLKSALSTISSGSGSQLLGVPEGDMRQEQLILGSEEAMVDLRKRDREALSRYNSQLKSVSSSKCSPKKCSTQGSATNSVADSDKKTVVLTGDMAIDNHCMPSTLTGEVGEMVDKFRRLKLKEYDDVCKMCKDNNVPLTEKLLQKVLLFPPDHPHSKLEGHIRQPAQPLLSSKFATESQNKHKTKTSSDVVKKSKGKKKTGRFVYGNFRGAQYPLAKSTVAREVKMHLSTGKAVVRRQVECWMSFEEYERLTSHLANRYSQIHGPSDSNAFWPGQLLDKLRLCMPPGEELVTPGGAVFTSTKQRGRTNVGYHNDLNTWPVSDTGYVQYGSIDK